MADDENDGMSNDDIDNLMNDFSGGESEANPDISAQAENENEDSAQTKSANSSKNISNEKEGLDSALLSALVDGTGGDSRAKALGGVPVEIAVMLGKADLRVNQLLKLGRGAVVELDRLMDEPVEIFANNTLIAKGEVIVTQDDKIGITITDTVKRYEF